MRPLIAAATVICLTFASHVSLAKDLGVATAIAWSPDGAAIAVASSTGLWMFDSDFEEIARIPIPELEGYLPTTIDWHANGDWIVVGNHRYEKRYDYKRPFSGDFPVLVIDAAQRKVISSFRFPRLSSEIRWHPNDRLIVAGEYDGTVKVVDAISSEALFVYRESQKTFDVGYNRPLALCWLDDSAFAIVTRDDVYIVDYVKNTTIHRISIDNVRLDLAFEAAACHDTGKIVTDLGYTIDALGATKQRIFALSSAFTIKDYWYDEWNIVDISWSPDGSQIATNGNAGLCRIGVFDGSSFELRAELQGSHARRFGRVHEDSIAWHPDGSRFAIVGKLDIRVWDANGHQLLKVFDGFEKRNPASRDSTSESSETEPILDPATWGLHCPALPDSIGDVAEH